MMTKKGGRWDKDKEGYPQGWQKKQKEAKNAAGWVKRS
jgi:hypothetical protein